MEVYQGKSVFGGIAIGRISVHKKDEQQVKRVRIEDSEQEILRYRQAKQTAMEQLQGLYRKALKEVGEANAAIFEIHQMMLEDDDYNESVENIIRMQQVNAEYAVASTGDNFAQMFSAMDDDYMRARSADVKDISERMLSVLGGRATGIAASGEPVIIVADDLAPSETVQLNKDLVLSFVTVHGSVNSHTAILARTMSIPALIGTDVALDETVDGKFAVVDGTNGVLYVEPDEETLETMRRRQREEQEKKELLQTLKGRETVTLDGKEIRLYANIGNSKDLASVIQNDAAGIGLFRSEFLYLEKETFPTEEEQFQVYKQVAETMAGKPVIIRTLDIGADKQCDYFELKKEENPAMGCRAIRICLTRPEIFKTQLRALFRASAYGNLQIMYPMITSVWEVEAIAKIVEEVKTELTAQNLQFGDPKQGIMIETPAAVMVSRELAKKVDFFSIGTNDLTQYTLAVDRGNAKVESLYTTFHPAVLRSIRHVIAEARQAGIPVGMCGEAAADPHMIPLLLSFGLDEFSVSASAVLATRKTIAGWRVGAASG